MLLTSASIVREDQDAADPSIGTDDRRVARELAAQVRSAFPDLSFSTARVEERGGDHRVLLLDATYAFRFPRAATHDLSVEIAVLAALRGRCGIAVPDYLFVDPAGRFAGYRFIAGDELTPRRFALLPADVRDHVLDQAGRFLAVLHGMVPEDVLPAGLWPTIGTHAGRNARERTPPRIARAFPELALLIDLSCGDHPGDVTARGVVVHGDLVDDHMLLAPGGGALAGIIDFGDVALGDPARDFLGFWAYGPRAVARVITAYIAAGGAGADDDLHDRSRRAFLRYRIDRFAELLRSDGKDAAARSLPEMIALLSAPHPDPSETIQRR